LAGFVSPVFLSPLNLGTRRPVVTADFPPESGFQRGIIEMREDNVTFRLAGFDMTMTEASGLGVPFARRPCHN
jgi:hypothetical protein